ncbi:MAG: carbohydrate kinase [Verrucomicrobia bacterium]|nr:carbohydrate kinase [Verrucomicrobiota bacterium]
MSVICFGEILWDFLPDGLFPGGAPFNVGYHLHRHGVRTQIVSAVGRDVLGDELLRRLALWGMPTSGIARHDRLPTGFVRATLGAGGDARYEITTDVAWDEIPATPETISAAAHADAFIYGSLAQRSTTTRASLLRLLAALPSPALRVFDVNLRPPHDDLALVRALAHDATLLKLNSDEAARLAGEAPTGGREEAHARALAAETGCALVVVTAGARGAGMLRNGEWYWEPGRAVQVSDTVGAGDAFLASLVTHLLGGVLPDAGCLARACRLGEWVAAQRGATPAYDATVPR